MAIAAIAASSAGDNQIVAAVPNKKIRVRGYRLHNGVATAQNVKWRSAAADITGLLYGPTAVGEIASDFATASLPGAGFLFETVAGEALNLNLSAATVVGGYVLYSLE